MILKFKDEGHQYISTNGEDIKWISATSIIHKFTEPFNAEESALKASKNPKSKWYKMTPEAIQAKWKEINQKSLTLGTAYHAMREEATLSAESIQKKGKPLPVVKPIMVDGWKLAPNQKLSEGIYPEHMVYLKSAGICGQSDLVEVIDGFVNILDYKSNREIKTEGFMAWDPISKSRREKMMLTPFSHLPACNLSEYNLQLSLYMYIILKHNPRLKPGTLTIEHVVFKSIGEDEFGYPIYATDSSGAPIVDYVVPYELPYLKEEVIALINTTKAA